MEAIGTLQNVAMIDEASTRRGKKVELVDGLVTRLNLRLPPLAVTGLAAALIWGIARLVPNLSVAIPLRSWIAAALALLGGAASLWAVVSFGRAKTTVNPLHPEATSQLVVHGMYHYSRNPMYLGMLLALGGWFVYYASVLGTAVLPCFVGYLNRFQIQPEEEMLTRKFGLAYKAYVGRVRRWL